MSSSALLWIPLLPLLGALINLTIGRKLSRGTVHFIAVAAVAASFGVVFAQVIGPLWKLFQAWHHHDPGAELPQLQQQVFTWIEVGNFKVDLAFRLDTLAAVMVLIVTFVGTLIHLYSTGYMADEKRYAAYFGYLNLFTGAMLMLVLGANLPVMFIGWEGVGVCSYLLIGFWFENPSYADAGRKAFVVNRIGDFAFLLGMFLLFWATKDLGFSSSLDFNDLRSTAAEGVYVKTFWGGERLAATGAILLFIGACGKSAQVPLYVWLPDAMAGPTPVSALIHAATMVTAGVYMVCRMSFLFASSTTAMIVVATIGMITAISAAFMAFAQTDLKRVLAYSTVSQLGFMFVAAGTGNWVAAIFHVGTHAFFKAGLFLGAGSVMHAMSGSGDITKMGGLRKLLPITHATFLIYCLAIAGIFPFAGFFSKDEILAGAYGSHGHHFEGWPSWYGYFLWIGLTIAALGTAFYMWRLYFLVFAGKCRADETTQSHIHESPWQMTLPLIVLAFLACVAGVIGLPHLTSWHPEGWQSMFHGLAEWLEPSVKEGTVGHISDGQTLGLMGFALAVGATGIGLAWYFYGKGPSKQVATWTAEGGVLHGTYEASKHKLWVDEVYEVIILRPFRALARALFEFVDRFLIDKVCVEGPAWAMSMFGRLSRWFQNGQVQRYMAGLLIGGALLFYVTRRDWQPTFSYENGGVGELVFRADPGAGPTGAGAKLRWDFDGDGAPDRRPALDRDGDGALDAWGPDEGWYDEAVVSRQTGEVGDRVTLWVTEPVYKTTKQVTRAIDLAAAKPQALSSAADVAAPGGVR